MAEPNGKKSKSPGAGKRPAPTIEGTATEVSVEMPAGAAPGIDTSDAGAPQGKSDDGETRPSRESEERQAHPGGKEDQKQSRPRKETKKAASSPPPPPPPTPDSRSFALHFAAGLLGGIIAVSALGFLWDWLGFGAEKTLAPQLSTLEERLAKLEHLEVAPEKLAALDTRLKTLETRAPDTLPEMSGLTDRLAEVETALKTMAEGAATGGDMTALDRRMTETERTLTAKIDAALAEAGDENAATVQALQDQIADLRTRLGAARQAELEPEVEALDSRLAKLEAALPGLADAIGKETMDAKSAALTIAFANLRAGVSEGRAYAAEFDTIKALSPNEADLSVLAAHAATGIPTVSELARRFQTAKDAALTEIAPASDGSFLDSLIGSAQSLVKIRRLDDPVMGDELSAGLARAAAKLDESDLADSVREIETLAGAPRESFATWLDQARARLGAEEALKQLEGRLLVSVSGAAAPRQEPQQEQD
jgi:Mitochondrial inner membrane protein